MILNRETMKAYNQEPEQCWECFNCVKICPQQAVEVRGYSDFVPLGSQTIPLRGSDNIMWTIKFRSGLTKRFKFPIRTTAEGTVDPYAGKPEPDFATLKKPGFFTTVQQELNNRGGEYKWKKKLVHFHIVRNQK